jgi:hypothetical protein
MPKEGGSVPLRADCRVFDGVGGMDTVPADLWIDASAGACRPRPSPLLPRPKRQRRQAPGSSSGAIR